jgi:glycosyl transferase, family 25
MRAEPVTRSTAASPVEERSGTPAQTIPIFVISLARAADRRAAIERHLRALGLEFECVDAVDGQALSADVLTKVTGPEKIPIGQVACSLSHLSVYERIVSQGIPVACVLEDDGRLLPPAVELLRKGCSGSDFDVCFLDCADRNHRGVVCFDRDSRTELAAGIHTYRLSDGPFNLHAYLISLSGARKRAGQIIPVREAIDRYDFGPLELRFRAILHPRVAFLSVLSRASTALNSTRRATISWYGLRGLPGYYALRDLVKGTWARRWREMRAKQAAGELPTPGRWRPLSGGTRILPE